LLLAKRQAARRRLAQIIRVQVQPGSASRQGRHREVPVCRAAHETAPARCPRERKQLHAPGLPAPTNDHGIRIRTDHSPEDGAESAVPKTALSIVQCVTAEATANASHRDGAPGLEVDLARVPHIALRRRVRAEQVAVAKFPTCATL
jgi:hypothetical protein